MRRQGVWNQRRGVTASVVGTFRIGYVSLVDAAPLIVAEEMGLFRRHGVMVTLSSELGWGSIREKIVYGEIDAAHAPGPLLFSIILGTHAKACRASTDLVLNLQGNAITLSRRLWDKGVRDLKTFRLAVRSEAPNRLVFAVVSRFSSHLFLLRKWLRLAGLDPDRDIRVVVLPPPLVAEHLREGQIDGFCAGEPWNSSAVLRGDGWVIATSRSLAPRHPEKVLLMRDDVRHLQREGCAALREAIVAACEYCERPGHREAVAGMLHARGVCRVEKSALMNSLVGPFNSGGDAIEEKGPFHIFHGENSCTASREKAAWCLEAVLETGALRADSRERAACLEAFVETPVEISN